MAIEALIERTTYPTDEASYASYASVFASAWQDKNPERMKRLSNSTVVSFFDKKVVAIAYSTSAARDGDFWNVSTYDASVSGGGFSFMLRIANASLGKANAIVSVSNL